MHNNMAEVEEATTPITTEPCAGSSSLPDAVVQDAKPVSTSPLTDVKVPVPEPEEVQDMVPSAMDCTEPEAEKEELDKARSPAGHISPANTPQVASPPQKDCSNPHEENMLCSTPNGDSAGAAIVQTAVSLSSSSSMSLSLSASPAKDSVTCKSPAVSTAQKSAAGMEQQIASCGECGEEYTDVESYMAHQCYKENHEIPALAPPSTLPPDIPEEALSDVESFDGKIVYNPDGSAYIIEGESDMSDTESLLDVPKQEGTIVDQRGKAITSHIPSYPQVANAFYIHRNPATFYNSFYMFPPENRPRAEAPIMHSYRVYDVRSGKQSECNKENEDKTDSSKSTSSNSTKLNLPATDVATVPTKPILMCFICKLSFGFAKSFVAHAIGEHNMSLNDNEKDIMSKRNSSAIIQGVGKDKDPLMSFLEPTSLPKTGGANASSSSTSSGAAASGVAETAVRTMLQQQSLFNQGLGHASSAGNNTSVSYVHSSTKVTSMEMNSRSSGGSDDDASMDAPCSSSGRSLTNSPRAGGHPHDAPLFNAKGANLQGGEGCGTPPRHPWTSRLDMDSGAPRNGVPRGMHFELGGGALTDDDEDSEDDEDRLHIATRSPRSADGESEAGSMSPRVQQAPNSPHALAGHSAASVAMPMVAAQLAAPASSSSSSPLQTAGSASPPYPVGPSSQVPASHHSQGIVIRIGCEDHPQGNITGIDCAKCEMLLGSTRSTLGSHMTMMHSRNSCKTLKCPKCNWHYKYQETLEIHMKEKHPENDAQCVYCMANQSHPRLARGEAYTCGYKPYRCEVCNYSTTTKGNLSIHMQSDKHINNMQELQNGTPPEIKMPPAPPPMTHDPMEASPTAVANMKKNSANKPKPTWRCDVCNYETNVARNLRIHMTSEKHTHNMMVLQQNVKHMQRDMQFQLNQMAAMGQDPNMMMGMPHVPPGMPPFSYDPSMFMVPPPGLMETPVDLSTQENGMAKAAMAIDVKNNNNEPCKIFQCAVCNVYSGDSVDALHQHMQLDRSKHGDQDNINMIGGTYICNLCQYKTNLKANFQLHCKTDKHLQRLMLVNHIREGGPSNEWRLKYMNMSNPVQVRCGACDYYTNSIHKLQLHLSAPRHDSNSKVFQHLQRCESKVPAEKKYFHCTLCNFSSKIKLNLIQHVHAMKHLRNESLCLLQLKEQGKEHEYTMDSIFVVKEYDENSPVSFDEPDGETVDQSVRPPIGSVGLHASGPPPPHMSHMPGMVLNHSAGAKEISANTGEGVHMCPFCNYSSSSLLRIEAHVAAQHSQPTLHLLCPLCQEKCPNKQVLEKHLVQVHSVTQEGLQRLMVMVETQTTWNQLPGLSTSALISSSSSSSNSAQPQQPQQQQQQHSHMAVSTPSTATVPTPATTESTTTSITNSSTSPANGSSNPPSATVAAPQTPTPATTLGSSRASPRPATPGASGAQSEEPAADPADLKAEILENQALKLAEEASMDGVVLSDKDADDQYRCQTCSKTFQNIDTLYAHQNELGHLELKQTPRGPGYLCWKKGCNQYFKTASALQMHFREIHAKRQQVSVSEKHIYKYRCNQCSLAFKTLEKLQIHSYYHIIRSATKCSICGRSFRSVTAMRKHVEGAHLDSMTPAQVEQYKASLAATAPLALMEIPGFDPQSLNFASLAQLHSQAAELRDSATEAMDDSSADKENDLTPSESGVDHDEDKLDSESRLMMDMSEDTNDSLGDRSQGGVTSETESQGDSNVYREEQFFEDYINSQAMAENSYSDPSRKYKCHRCKVAFTKQNYLSAHNKTLLHRKGDKLSYPMEKYMDPNRPFKCDVCKESFTQKNILLVHYNSVSHLHKLKQVTQQHDGTSTSMDLSLTTETGATPSTAPSTSPVAASSSTTATTTTTSSASPDADRKPYRCNICKVAYKESSTLDIHIRSVFHQTRASKLPELAATGQVDITQPLIEQPDQPQHKPALSQEQQQKVLNEMLQLQRPGSLALSSPAPSTSQVAKPTTPSVHKPVSLTMPSPVATPTSIPSPATTPHTPKQAPVPLQCSTPVTATPATPGSQSRLDDKLTMTPTQQQASQQPVYACSRCNSLFGSQETLQQHQQMFCFMPSGFQRGMPRFKPHVQRNLLENIGFECVMQFNEFHQRVKRDEKIESDSDSKMDTEETKTEETKAEGSTEGVKDDKPEEGDTAEKAEVDKKAEQDKKLSDLPEMNIGRCHDCGKQFSSVWVLKAHQEEVHRDIVPIDYVEKFSQKFKEEYEKKQEKLQAEQHTVPDVSIKTETADQAKFPLPTLSDSDKAVAALMGCNLGGDLSAAQAAQMMQIPMFNMMPMGMNLMGMNMGMMPMMMPMGPEMFGMPGMHMMDPSFMMAQQQQQQQQQQHQQAAALAAAQQNKRARTRINDEQLKVLRGYFDINNSPSEEQTMKMSEETGLPAKVIKHWFRNTLFKERQRNKDSPYNFNVPPATTLNLEEYEKTGKIPVSMDPESEKVIPPIPRLYREKEPLPRQPDTHDRESVLSTGDSSTMSSASSTPVPAMPPSTPMGGYPASVPSSLGISVASPATSMLSPTSQSPRSKAGISPFSMSQLSPGETSPQSGLPGRRANRTRFTDYQIKCLQDYFDQNAYPKDDDLDNLSKMLNLSPRVIVVWFQNARQKARKNYENQPALDMSEDGTRFTRTPGLNYQCKKCFTVFQRYFELIKHQRSQCYKDDQKSINSSMGSPPSDSNSSNASAQGSQAASNISMSEHAEEKVEKVPQAPIVKVKEEKTSPSKPSSSRSDDPEYKCEKCNLVFPRFELWQEHQNVHSMNPNLFSPFTPNSAFGMLQSIAQQQPQSQQQQQQQPLLGAGVPPPPPPPPPPPRRDDRTVQQEEEDAAEREEQQQRDKRLRTTILPEQLDYLYQQYQVDCNPSRKQLETISSDVGLKKRVVQVWFQNTRARERKGQYRAHQQLIHKRCPFCRALFRAKSALESHLATKHPEEMAKGDVNIDAIPDAALDSSLSSTSSSEPSGLNTSNTPNAPALDMARLLNNPYNMPNPFMPMLSPSGMPMPLPNIPNDPVQNNMKNLYEESLKKYLNDLSGATHQPMMSKPSVLETMGLKSPAVSTASSNRLSSQVKVEADDAPLDLSKPVKSSTPSEKSSEAHRARLSVSNLEQHRSRMDHHTPRHGMDSPRLSMDSPRLGMDTLYNTPHSDTHSVSSDNNEESMMMGSNPPSPSSSTSSMLTSTTTQSKAGCITNKRYRTQMSSTQIKVMKNLFLDYKTPTMAECEMLGNLIGLAKRVVQVWFQNARAKEKKYAQTYNKPFEVDFQRPSDKCSLCNFKYSHKYTVQDHIFTKRHIEQVRSYVQSQTDSEREYSHSDPSMMRHRDMAQESSQPTTPKTWTPGTADTSLVAHPHLAQLHAMGLQAMGLSGEGEGKKDRSRSRSREERSREERSNSSHSVKKETNDSRTSTRKSESTISSSSVTMPTMSTSSASFFNPFSSPLGMPSPADMNAAAAAGMLPLLYPGMGGFMPGAMPGMPMMPPSMMSGPENMFMYDPSTFGTPLSLLQIPQQAISDVQGKLQEEGCVRARYTQDCKMISDLKPMVGSSDYSCAREAMVDVGYICRKCQMVYPGKDACMVHQQMVCYQGKNPSEAGAILKLEQIQYDCTACQIKFSTLQEFKVHCDMDMHKHKAESRQARSGSPRVASPRVHAVKRELELTSNNNSAPTVEDSEIGAYQEAKKIKTE